MFRKFDKPPETGRSDSGPGGATASPGSEAGSGQSGVATGKGGETRSVVSADVKIVGNLQSAGDIQIEGTVEGDIRSRGLTVGESAQIEGSISADTVRICGSVNGQVKATAVTISKTAKVVGDITYQTLAIEEGALFEGQCRRSDPQKVVVEPKVAEIKRTQPETAIKAAPAPAPATGGGAGGKPLAR